MSPHPQIPISQQQASSHEAAATSEVQLNRLADLVAGANSFALSVVIVTRDRASYLEMVLNSLEQQLLSSQYWEVIIADDASFDSTPEIVEEYEKSGSFSLRYLRSERQCGYAQIRKQALQEARGTVIVFLGDHEIAIPNFLIQHLGHHIEENVFVLGDSSRYIQTHLCNSVDYLLPGVAATRFLSPQDFPQSPLCPNLIWQGGTDYGAIWRYFEEKQLPTPYPWAYFEGGNASVRRELTTAYAEPMLEANHAPSGERSLDDSHFALQLYKAGVQFRFDAQAVALSQTRPIQLRDEDEKGYWRSLNAFFALHPELSRTQVEFMICH